MTDWRKQLIKQAAIHNIHWGLSKIPRNPDKLMVWLDAYEAGALSPAGLLSEEPYPVRLPMPIELIYLGGGKSGGRFDDPTAQFGLVDDWLLTTNLRDMFRYYAIRGFKENILTAPQLVEAELAYRHALKRYQDVMGASLKEARDSVSVEVVARWQKRACKRVIYGFRDFMYDETDNWMLARIGSPDPNGVIYVHMRVTDAEFYVDILADSTLTRTPEVHPNSLVYEWSLSRPRLNPWTRSEK